MLPLTLSTAVLRLYISQFSQFQQFSLLVPQICSVQRYLENIAYTAWFYGGIISIVFRSFEPNYSNLGYNLSLSTFFIYRYVLIKYADRGLVKHKLYKGGMKLFHILFWLSCFFFYFVAQANVIGYYFKKNEFFFLKTFR